MIKIIRKTDERWKKKIRRKEEWKKRVIIYEEMDQGTWKFKFGLQLDAK